MRGRSASQTANMACDRCGPAKATTIMASSSDGIDSRVSRIWFSTAERRPWVDPAKTPSARPQSVAASVTTNAPPTVGAAPLSRRLNTSRPRSSVPRKKETSP
jgi:hypothetical protein